MRSSGMCVRVTAAAVVISVFFLASTLMPDRAAVRQRDLRAVDDARSFARSGTAATSFLPAPFSSSPSTAMKRGTDSLARADFNAAPRSFLAQSNFSLPMMFEQSAAQPGDAAQFTARGRGALYQLTAQGIAIESSDAGAARRVEIRFVDTGAVGDGTKPRKHRGSSKGRTGKSRKRGKSGGRGKSSRAGRVSGTRPSDGTRPSRRERNQVAAQELAPLRWQGEEKLAAETNYFVGSDPSNWRTHVANFASVRAKDVVPGIDVVLRSVGGEAEYDLDVAAGMDAARVAVQIAPSDLQWRVDAGGDLVARDARGEFRMRRPVSYEIERDGTEARRKYLASEYVIEADGMVGFRVEGRDADDELVIDPAIEVTYFSFLGGAGTDSAASVAVDSAGNVYVGGTTTSAQSFPDAFNLSYANGSRQSDFFVAKIIPGKSGAASLAFLTFLGGSGTQSGGNIAVNAAGSLAIAGTTTSGDYPVTDGSTYPVNGGGTNTVNGVAVSELSQTDGSLTFSTLFGGNGNEAKLSNGGVAFGPAGQIFVGMDTTSTNLPVCPSTTANANCTTTGTAFQPVYAGGQTAGESGGSFTDGFFVEFAAPAQGKSSILYCTYLGIYGTATVSGIAVDAESNVYLAGSSSNPQNSQGFPFLNTIQPPQQPAYAGGDFDGFVIKIRPSGTGATDESYGTMLGGSGTDKVTGIAISSAPPQTVYVTGYTSSVNFPQNAAVPAFQPTLGSGATANAFLAVISQNVDFATTLAYATYLGGGGNDSGNAIFCGADKNIYIAGTTTSPMFPWLYNLKPFEGTSDAFVAEIDPTANGAGLLFATPLGGQISSGASVAHGNAVAADASGNVYVVGDTTSSDFAPPGNPANGFQQVCVSCSQSPALPDAFVAGLALSQSISSPSVVFNRASLTFGTLPIGVENDEPIAVYNSGDQALVIPSDGIAISGPNANDFTLLGASGCLSASIPPVGATGVESKCSFAIGFAPSVAGTETAFITISDNAPGGAQVIPAVGVGQSLLTATPAALVFASVPPNTTETEQTIQLVNTSDATLSLTYAVQNSNAFNVVPGSCQTMAPTSTCVAAVTFSPTTTGNFTAQLIVSYSSQGTSPGQASVALSGSSAMKAPSVELVPASISFPPTGVGTTSVSETVQVENAGTAAATLSVVSLTGGNASNFTVSPGAAGGCPLSGGTLAPSSACTIAVTFTASSAGNFSATLNVADNAPGSPQSVPLQATAVTLGATLSTASVGFGTSTVGLSTSPVSVTLTNSGASPLAISSIGVSGADPGDFTAPNNCPASLGVKMTCALSVTFNPTAAGNRSATVQISDSAPQSPQSIAVSGNAVMAQMSVSPTTANFGSQLTSTASAAQTITVTNSAASPAMLQVASASVTGSTDFTIEKNGCTSQIAAGATCAIMVKFDPGTLTTSSSRSGTLVIQSNAQTGSASVALTGSADDFELGPASSGGASISVTAGTTASFSLDLTSIGGFTGAVTLACSGTSLPGTCTVAPSSITAAANAQEAFAVSIPTTTAEAHRAGLLARWFGTRSSGHRDVTRFNAIGAWPLLAVTILGCVCAFASTRKRPTVSALRAATAFAILMCVLVFGISSCGGGSAASDPPPDPPSSQSYSLTVTATYQTATSTTVTRSLPLTLMVTTD
jgi:hypothetical protein